MAAGRAVVPRGAVALPGASAIAGRGGDAVRLAVWTVVIVLAIAFAHVSNRAAATAAAQGRCVAEFRARGREILHVADACPRAGANAVPRTRGLRVTMDIAVLSIVTIITSAAARFSAHAFAAAIITVRVARWPIELWCTYAAGRAVEMPAACALATKGAIAVAAAR